MAGAAAHARDGTMSHAPVRPSAVVRGRNGGTLILATPWARQAVPEADRQGIADRVPAGHTLFLSARSSRTDWSSRLYARDENPTEPIVELLHQRDPRRALERALAEGRIRDCLCWFCLQPTDEDARLVTVDGRTESLCWRCYEHGDESPPVPLDYMEVEGA